MHLMALEAQQSPRRPMKDSSPPKRRGNTTGSSNWAISLRHCS
jgi:hypothetical protein